MKCKVSKSSDRGRMLTNPGAAAAARGTQTEAAPPRDVVVRGKELPTNESVERKKLLAEV